jgi:hypothetical protein
MTRRLLTLPAVPMAIALLTLIAPPVATQTDRGPALSIAAYSSGPSTSSVTPKTP